MRVSRETLAAHRDNILTAAGRMFRQRGIEGVTVAEIMQTAGLTHGGFYGHYRSKGELAAASCRNVLADSARRWRERASAASDPIDAIIAGYLSAAALEHPERGCPIPTLGIEVARCGGPAAEAMAEGVEELLAILQALCPRPEAEREAAAMAALSAMVGGIMLARTCNDTARALAVLDAARSTANNVMKIAT
jgi:TetR/AcrR family transcriptional repressor of nem operon